MIHVFSKSGVGLIILFVLINCRALSQQLPTEYKFRMCSPEGGFYYDGVKSIKQDKSGFIWILMDNDLFRFDGYQYVSYYRNFRNLDSSTKWKFNYIETDTLGQLYVVANNKLFIHHEDMNRFECLLDSTVSFLKIDKKNRIWLKTTQLYLYNQESGKLTPMTYNGNPISNVSNFFSDGDCLYAWSIEGAIYCVNPESGKFTLRANLPQNNYYANIVCKDKTIWACTNKNKLYHIDSKSFETIKTYDFLYTPENYVNTLYIDPFENVWIGTRRGLYILNPQTDKHYQLQNIQNDPFSIPENSVWTISEDRQQNIWIGTYSGGLCYVDPKEKNPFKSYSPKQINISYHIVSGFTETGKKLWVATEGGGINVIDKKTGTISYKKHNLNENSLAYNNVKSMVTDSIRKNIWISMFQGGLDCYHIPTKTFTHYKNDPQNMNSLRFNDLRKIIMESDSGLWIAYQSEKLLLSYFSFEKRSFEHFSMNELLGDNYVFDICRDTTTDDLWIVTHRRMYRMNVKNKKLEEISSPYVVNGQSLCVDSEHNVWIGTVGNGLIKYAVKDSTYHKYDDILKFKVSTIYSICSDYYGCLWLGSDNGLFRFNPHTGAFVQFIKDDGVQGQVFYPLASMQSASGEIYFGGTSGFTIVTDPNIRINTYKPDAMISDILIDNVSILFDSTLFVRSKGELTLSYDKSNIGFLFSSDNYLTPAKNRFKYRLVGYDDHWVETDASNRYAFFTKLPAGHYTFEVIASNNDGIWSDTPLQVNIRHLPAPWFSVWAYVTYTLAVLLTVFLILKYYYRQKQLEMALYKESMEKQQREEIHQSQLSFFTNISHEFKTTLSLISAVADTLRKEGLREFYFRILNNNTQRLLHLMNELMLFRTVESGKQPLHLEMTDINAFVFDIAGDFSDFARQHRIHYSITPDEALSDKLPADRMILEKIIINLLNNAFKYTPDEGSISITVYSDIQRYIPSYCNSFHTGNEQVENPFYIVVHDTGVGISEPSINKIFERFYKVNASENKHIGSGIGLALVKSLVMLHKGSITVYSERGKGADMVVAFSGNATSYNESDFMEPDSSNDYLQPDTTVLIEEENTQLADIYKDEELYLRENKRILIAEDNKDLRKLIVDFLSSCYDVVEVSNGIEASNLIRDTEIDLIISDIMMPMKDGISLCSEMKNDINSSHIPFIMLTAKTGMESELEGFSAGADVYIEKPVNFDFLIQVIRNIFKRQDSLKDYYAKHYFANSSDIPANRQYNAFLKKLYDLLDANLDKPELDVDYIALELSMSKTKLYKKLKSITGKSLIEIILSYRLRKAARIMVEEDLSIREVIMQVGIESQSYFTRMFKKEFGVTPSVFAMKNRKRS